MVQPQMDRDRFRNVSNLDLVEPNQIRDLMYHCIRLLFANFWTLKMLLFDDVGYSPDASSNVSYVSSSVSYFVLVAELATPPKIELCH